MKAGAVTINYGVFLNAVLNFLIVAAAIFWMVRLIQKLHKPPAPVAAAPPPTEVLLGEIRDILKVATDHIRKEKQFFFEKKNQKTSFTLAVTCGSVITTRIVPAYPRHQPTVIASKAKQSSRLRHRARRRCHPHSPSQKKFFCFFLFTKRSLSFLLSFLTYPTPPPAPTETPPASAPLHRKYPRSRTSSLPFSSGIFVSINKFHPTHRLQSGNVNCTTS